MLTDERIRALVEDATLGRPYAEYDLAPIREAIRQAIRETAEACAKIADWEQTDAEERERIERSFFDQGWARGALTVAAAIRQRVGGG